SKTRLRKETGASEWTKERATHYTGIGTEIRENFTENDSSTKVVVNMPQGLGRYGMESDDGTRKGNEFYLKNHLGSTMVVARVADSGAPAEVAAAYDYRAFGEQVTLIEPTDKVTETFTGKELDDETELNYFGARYLDPMLGLWISVDAAGQFASPYLYAGNGLNPVNGVDADGDVLVNEIGKRMYESAKEQKFWNNPHIKAAYEFANTTPIKITVLRQQEPIFRDGGEYAGMTDPDDDEILTSATVLFSGDYASTYAEIFGVSFKEASARILSHEFNAHIKNFVPESKAEEAGKDAADMEHAANADLEKALFPGQEEFGE
ncbi:RHS repeat-associated core domain-containing protein, partial [Fibrobacter intestinalis]